MSTLVSRQKFKFAFASNLEKWMVLSEKWINHNWLKTFHECLPKTNTLAFFVWEFLTQRNVFNIIKWLMAKTKQNAEPHYSCVSYSITPITVWNKMFLLQSINHWALPFLHFIQYLSLQSLYTINLKIEQSIIKWVALFKLSLLQKNYLQDIQTLQLN